MKGSGETVPARIGWVVKLAGVAAAAVAILALAMLGGTGGAIAAEPGASDPGGSDSILVKLEPGANAQEVARSHGMRVKRDLSEIGWVELEPQPHGRLADAPPATLANRVGNDPDVRSVDAADKREKVSWDFIPRDPLFSAGLVYEDGTSIAWHFVKPNFPIAWDQTLGGGVNVAVIDSEFDTSNPDLGPKLVQRYNVASGTAQYHTGNVDAQPGDVFHGSHTAGLVGALTDNGKGVAGACFECGIVAIKIGSEPSGTFVDASFLGDVAEGLIYAANSGARVVSMSLGGPRPHQPLLDAVNYAASKGLVIVASAGNSQLTNPGVPNYPAAYPNVIGVGATNSQDQIAPFSSQGSWVDLVAPGENILSTVNKEDPELLGTLDPEAPQVAVGIKSGTSMSAPIVAGLATLMIAARPDLTAGEVEALMESTAKDLGIAGPDPTYGHGRIEAGAAVAAARAYVRPAPPAPPTPAPAPAPAPVVKPKLRKIGGRVLIRRRRHKGKLIVYGKISTAKKCQAERAVVLFAKKRKKPLAKTKTNRRGRYKIVLKKAPRRRIRVKVRARRVNSRLLCRGSGTKYLGA